MTEAPTIESPESESALAEIVREERRPIRPFGSGTKSSMDPASSAESVPVCLRKLDRIVEYVPGDLVVTVQAGMRLADLQAELAKHNQWLPIDPPHADATIGGILATNSSGPRRLAYGTARDLLLGLRVVGADGVATKSGGRVVKNVTGYDLPKLHIGAFGVLGVITEASFKVRPRPEVSAVFAVACASFGEAHALLLKMFDARLSPCALEALDGVLAGAVGGGETPPLPGALALIGVEGTTEIIERHAREIAGLGAGRPRPYVADTTWSSIRDLPGRLADKVRIRIGAKPHDLPGVLSECGPSASRWARVGTGIAWLDMNPAADLPNQISRWHERAAAKGGYAVVESAPLDLPGRERLPWGSLTPLMQKIREAWDPDRKFHG